MSELVLVTGAYGYIASQCVLQLLAHGYRVRGTLRKLVAHEPGVRRIVAQAGAANDQLELVQADLEADQGWEQAVQGCAYVLHVASPVGVGVSRGQAESLVRPAREGTLRVLKAAAAAGVRRLVLTSSLAAVLEGHKDYQRVFDEKDWTELEGNLRPYALSKTLAERAAWDFVNQLGPESSLELAVINPANVFGPILDPRHTLSVELIIRMLRRAYPGCARIHWMLADVRDVAAAHLLAMTSPAAAGERFCCLSDCLWMDEIARILNKHFSSRGYHVPERLLPDGLIRLVTLFDPKARELLPSLGLKWQISNRKLVALLGWQPRPTEDILVDTAESLIRFGLV
jgi:dihydroflavonol-4-reductase